MKIDIKVTGVVAEGKSHLLLLLQRALHEEYDLSEIKSSYHLHETMERFRATVKHKK